MRHEIVTTSTIHVNDDAQLAKVENHAVRFPSRSSAERLNSEEHGAAADETSISALVTAQDSF